jgi:hypothetical protein
MSVCRKPLNLLMGLAATGLLMILMWIVGSSYSLHHRKGFPDSDYDLVQTGMPRASVELILGTPLRSGIAAETTRKLSSSGKRMMTASWFSSFDRSSTTLRKDRLRIETPSALDRLMQRATDGLTFPPRD